MSVHAKKHGIADTADHAPGTDDNVVGTVAGAVAEVPFDDAAATAGTLAQRDALGDIVVPVSPGLANAAASKQYVDNVAVGLQWLAPVSVLKIHDDTAQAGAPPAAGSVGEAWVVDTWGGGYNDGDIVEWDGSTWNVVVSNAAGFPPSGTRAIVDTGAAGSFNGQDNDVAVADGVGGWSFISPVDGNALLISGENSIYENDAYTYDATPGAWIKFASLIAAQIRADVTLAGATPVNADVASWANGDRGFGIGTDSSVWWMRKQGGSVFSVQMT